MGRSQTPQDRKEACSHDTAIHSSINTAWMIPSTPTYDIGHLKNPQFIPEDKTLRLDFQESNHPVMSFGRPRLQRQQPRLVQGAIPNREAMI